MAPARPERRRAPSAATLRPQAPRGRRCSPFGQCRPFGQCSRIGDGKARHSRLGGHHRAHRSRVPNARSESRRARRFFTPSARRSSSSSPAWCRLGRTECCAATCSAAGSAPPAYSTFLPRCRASPPSSSTSCFPLPATSAPAPPIGSPPGCSRFWAASPASRGSCRPSPRSIPREAAFAAPRCGFSPARIWNAHDARLPLERRHQRGLRSLRRRRLVHPLSAAAGSARLRVVVASSGADGTRTRGLRRDRPAL